MPLMRDARVPMNLKIGTALIALLIVSPVNVFGAIPLVGILDDAVLLTLLCSAFVRLAARSITRTA